MSQSPREPESLAEGTLISHLLELRTRLLRAVVAVVICFVPLAFFSNQLFTLVAHPLIEKLPEGTSIIATSVVSPFMTPLKLSLIGGVFIAMPYILYQIWAFVAPGLYRHEKRFALPLFVSSVVLFYVGVAFAYYVVFPLVFAFMVATTPDGVSMMTDISAYLDFVLALETHPRFLRRWGRGTSLQDVYGVLLHYLRGLGREDVLLEAGRAHYTDISCIYLPERIDLHPEADRNFLLYKAMVTHKFCQIHLGTFLLDLGRLRPLERRLEKRYGQSLPPNMASDLSRFLHLFPEPGLAAALFNLADTIRIEGWISDNLPGLHRELRVLKRELGLRRGEMEDLPPRSRVVENLQQMWLTGRCGAAGAAAGCRWRDHDLELRCGRPGGEAHRPRGQAAALGVRRDGPFGLAGGRRRDACGRQAGPEDLRAARRHRYRQSRHCRYRGRRSRPGRTTPT